MFDRSRWSAIGAALAVTVAGGVGLPSANATISSGERAVFAPIAPCRLFDTRPAPSTVGTRATPLGPGESVVQRVTGTNGNCVIPADATAVAMNVTVVNGTESSYLTVWPSDVTRPLASNLNWSAGSGPIPNKVDVKVSVTGTVSVFNNGGTVDVIADIVGYYADHDHDDRYYTKAQTDAAVASADDSLRTDTYSHYALQNFNPGTPAFLPIAGSCVTNGGTSGNGVVFIVPLIVPVGSRLISVDVATYDGASTAMVVSLTRTTLSGTGASDVDIAVGGGSSAPPAVDHDVLVPASTEIVAAGESFSVYLGNMLFGNGFCSLTVTYDTDG